MTGGGARPRAAGRRPEAEPARGGRRRGAGNIGKIKVVHIPQYAYPCDLYKLWEVSYDPSCAPGPYTTLFTCHPTRRTPSQPPKRAPAAAAAAAAGLVAEEATEATVEVVDEVVSGCAGGSCNAPGATGA